MRISDWSSDVCSSDLLELLLIGIEELLMLRRGDPVPGITGDIPADRGFVLQRIEVFRLAGQQVEHRLALEQDGSRPRGRPWRGRRRTATRRSRTAWPTQWRQPPRRPRPCLTAASAPTRNPPQGAFLS